MKDLIGNTLADFQMGPTQKVGKACVVPVLGGPEPTFDYQSLSFALREGGIRVQEINEAGSVPQLIVHNTTEKAVLLLDGEELVGAKQNRVLNTTILVEARSKLTVPVSCTEQGRWQYDSPEFHDSGHVAAREVRRLKNLSVHDSVRERGSYESDQGAVWSEISALHVRHGTSSRTSAMRDVFEARRKNMDEVVKALPCLDGQRGMFFLVGSRVLGLDVVSRPEVYADLHDKLVRSYAIDLPPTAPDGDADAEETAYKFLAGIQKSTASESASVGLGTDVRLTSDELFGAALTYREEVIHLNCFPAEPTHGGRDRSTMADYRSRRRFFWE